METNVFQYMFFFTLEEKMRFRNLPNKHPQAHNGSSMENPTYEGLSDPLPLDIHGQEGYKTPHLRIEPKRKY